MKRLLLTLPLLGLTACATNQRPYAPVQNVRYQAIGHAPFWSVVIGDDRIVLRAPPEGGDPLESTVAIFPRTLPRAVEGVRTWESGEGTAVISIEARPGPCEGWAGRLYEDHVSVRLSGRELNGCGGRPIEARD